VRPARLFVGVANAVPKLVAYRVLEPALELQPRVELVIVEDRPERLMAELASYALDLVLTDAQLASAPSVRAYHHPLGESPVGIFAAQRLAARYRRGFPGSLEGAPFLVPTPQSSMRRALDAWFERSRVRPGIVGEFDDMALLKVFGAQGKGLFAAPTVIASDLRARYGASLLGEAAGVRERFYAITLERRIQNPAVAALTSAARTRLFGE
jgi:LysR family transcriptional activator of nhaA